jgi:tricorn protease
MSRVSTSILIALGLVAAPPVLAQTKLLRFPDIHADRVVFCYAGDLWVAPAGGGTAARLTAHPGVEVFPKFSPDGEWIAFTGQYDGDEQVYVIPAAGGVPKQLTFYPARGPLAPRWGYDNQVYGWTRDGRHVQVRSMFDGWSQGETRQYLVPMAGGLPRPLPMPVSGAADFSPDASHIVYNPTARDFRTWKRYQGGWQQDLWIFDVAANRAEKVVDSPRTDRDPMWIGEAIYFNSDRDGHLNLYAYDLRSRATRALTHETTYDVRWPSDDDRGRIVYELNGELRVLDTASGESRPIPILVPNDGVAMRPTRVVVDRWVEDFELSPKGERALFVARGDVFTVPIEKGPTRNLTATSTAHEKWARWSPDGKRVAWMSDASGEDEIWIGNQDGTGEPERVTRDGRVMRYAPEWSPDGKRLAFADKDGRLYVTTLGGRVEQIADDPREQIRDYTWAPDSRWLAFTMSENTDYRSIWIWGEGGLHRVTGEMSDDWSPAWDPGGKYLYFFANHTYEPQLSTVEFNFATDRMTGIFAMALRKDVPHPFPPESDEADADSAAAGNGDDKAEKGKDKGAKKGKGGDAKKIEIEFDGIESRVAPVPVPADNYAALTAVPGHLLYVRNGGAYYARESHRKPELRLFTFEDRKETTLAENVSGHAVSRDGKTVLVQHENEYKRYDVGPKGKDSAKAVAVKNMAADIVPAQEWAQIFDEAWRRYRDFFYAPNMHGYDWEALGRQYRALLPYVGHRSDLNYVLGEMVAELNVSHTYIVGGDWQAPARAPVALPGARFELDERAGRYRIAKIFRGENTEERYRSPLTEVGVDARVGDYVLAIDGEDLRADDSPYRLLRYKADRPVTLTLAARPQGGGSRQVTFRPIQSETDLLYLDWTTANRERVTQLSDGRVGYIHLPDMGGNGIREFVKTFYPQIRKEGLVVDVRSNGGGNVSQMLIERLRRELLGTRFSRNDDAPNTYPSEVFYGPKVCLLDENSSSDGDIFPHMFRQARIGPLIGKRSWGGVVGITNRGPLLDGGGVTVPEFGTNAPDGPWVIEGHGVEPDIEVDNDAAAVLAGRDPQLERGVAEVLEVMRTKPMRLPARPAPPVRTN